MIVILVLLNIVGIKEAASLNIFLALVDFATQLLLVVLGFFLIFDAHLLTSNVHWARRRPGRASPSRSRSR